MDDGIRRVVVIGAGTMGHGIAQVAAMAGCEAAISDVSEERVRAGLAAVENNLDKGVARGKVSEETRTSTLARLSAAVDLETAAGSADLVIEAVPEDLDLKRSLFERLDRAAKDGAILASNTSSLSIGKIAAATSRAGTVVGMHFFNPVHIMPLLEVVRADGTDDETVDRVVAFGRRLGKDPIVVRDFPGFATSRLGVVLGLEAIRMLEQGVASAEDIDKAMTLGYRHPMGPLRLTDLVGLDVRLAIAKHLHAELDSEAFRPPALLERKVAEGATGKKAGRGFYDWSDAG